MALRKTATTIRSRQLGKVQKVRTDTCSWILDNGSSHRGQRCVERLQNRYGNLRVVHGPIHASWLNQIEIYFSIIQRKVLTPNDFASLTLLADRLERFERHYEIIAKPFEWKFTRHDLAKLMQRLHPQPPQALAA
jgi:hypothetical protein